MHGSNLDSQELALQVLDIVSLRPELELCYLGIQTKCFEILEYAGNEKFSNNNNGGFHDASSGPISPAGSSLSTESEGDSDDNTPAPHHHHHHHHNHHHHIHHHTPADDDVDDDDDDDEEPADFSDDDSMDETDRAGKKGKHFKLREILFYDDKVSIFKARHGRI